MRYFFYFSGDFGGYIGLLLGGSVLSMVEIIDFFVYNFLRKLSKRRQIKPQKEEREGAGDMKPKVAYIPSGNPTKIIAVQPASGRPVYNHEKLDAPKIILTSHA